MVTGFVGVVSVQSAPAGELLNARMEHAGDETLLEALVEVAHRPQLGLDPALVDARLELFEYGQGEVLLHHCIKRRLRGQHAALDREMNSLQPLRIEEAGRV